MDVLPHSYSMGSAGSTHPTVENIFIWIRGHHKYYYYDFILNYLYILISIFLDLT